MKKNLGVKENRDINQIGNMALVEWADNIDISDEAPALYWPEQVAKKNLDPDRLRQQEELHALPDGWQEMEYQEFLAARRSLMAQVVEKAYRQLTDTAYSPSYPPAGTYTSPASNESKGDDEYGHGLTLGDLISLGALQEGTTLTGLVDGEAVEAILLADGSIEYQGEVFTSPSGAGKAALGRVVNGWWFWRAETEGGSKRLRRIRREQATGAGDEEEDDGED